MGTGLRVVMAGGGTGGHLYPGIAVARELLARCPDATVTFAGTSKGIESRVVPREGFELDTIRSGGLKGKSIVDRLRGATLVPLGLLDAWTLLSSRRPDLVIGVGGYSSGPVVLAAAARRIPTMVLEQNAVPGLTNRMLAHVVRAAAVTYDTTKSYFGGRAFVSGNPVRAEFVTGESRNSQANRDGVGILVFGGSQGAHAINVAMVDAAPALANMGAGLHLTHQTGDRDVDLVKEGYRAAGLEAQVEPFIYDMAARLAQADLVVCRAGATTLAELMASGTPSILVPLPTATDDHQRKNAEALASEGAAVMMLQTEATGAALAARIAFLVNDVSARMRMSAAARRLARPEAAKVIVDRALELVRAC